MANRPNVLIIYPDQWRSDALSCAGTPQVATPNLDQLAASGARFTHAFVSNPVCTPSRASFMTGRYPHSTGVTANNLALPQSEACFAEALGQVGYRTGYIGKWHLDGPGDPGFVPPDRRFGWQWWAAYTRGHRYYDGVYFRDSPTPITTPGFEPDNQTELAIEFCEEAARDEQPFCLMLAWGPPHTRLDPPQRWREMYDSAGVDLPASVPGYVHQRAREERARHFGLVSALDHNVGRLLDMLDRLDLTSNTIVVFTSDHGDSLGEHGMFRKPYRFDETSRVPGIWRWPGHIAAGTTADALMLSIDIAPTLLAMCGAPVPDGVQGLDLSGVARTGSNGPRDAVYLEAEIGTPAEWRALRTRRHLVAVNASGAVQMLFDLAEDPLALTNLADDPRFRDTCSALLEQLVEAARTFDDPLLPALAER